ncbi:MAG: hypothetical protein V4858_04360 [Pseudomonadota bacterium]
MNKTSPYVYDKAKYHYESVEEAGLPDEHACNHTVPILRWLIENDLMSDFFVEEGAEPLARYKTSELTIHGLYEWWDNCLIDDMVSDEGNAFGRHYFAFETGKYLPDYIATLQGNLPSEFHVEYSEANYAKIRAVIDNRYEQWKATRA